MILGMDGSLAARRAARYLAADVLLRPRITVIVVHVLDTARLDAKSHQRQFVAAETMLSDGWTAPLRAAGVAMETLIWEGKLHATLSEVAEKFGAVAVVLGRPVNRIPRFRRSTARAMRSETSLPVGVVGPRWPDVAVTWGRAQTPAVLRLDTVNPR